MGKGRRRDGIGLEGKGKNARAASKVYQEKVYTQLIYVYVHVNDNISLQYTWYFSRKIYTWHHFLT